MRTWPLRVHLRSRSGPHPLPSGSIALIGPTCTPSVTDGAHLWGRGEHLILIQRPWLPGAGPSETGPVWSELALGDWSLCPIKGRLRGDGWRRSLIGPRKPLTDPATESDPVFMGPAEEENQR